MCHQAPYYCIVGSLQNGSFLVHGALRAPNGEDNITHGDPIASSWSTYKSPTPQHCTTLELSLKGIYCMSSSPTVFVAIETMMDLFSSTHKEGNWWKLCDRHIQVLGSKILLHLSHTI